MKALVVLVLVACVFVSGCKPGAKKTPSQTNAPVVMYVPEKAQPKLQTIKLWIGNEGAHVQAEMALGEVERMTGMMFRQEMGENEAMLFVFPIAHQTSFWMKNTFVPLSAAYIDPKGVILEIHDLQPQNTNSVAATATNILYVLETRQGWFDRHNIKTGTVVGTEYGPLSSVFSAAGARR